MSKIKIYSRVRNNYLQSIKNRPLKITINEENIELFQEKNNIYNKKYIEKYLFNFDKIFDIDYTNEDIYNEIGCQLIDNLIKNTNSVFYVYGQTGSGKSYTLLGDEINKNSGIIELILSQLIIRGIEFKYNGIQIYNNKCYDIFDNTILKEYESNDGSIKFLNIKNRKISNISSCHNIAHEISSIIFNIKSKRYVGVSSSNDVSSRSHFIFEIYNNNNYIKIIDLAGSERARNGFNNNNFKENANINLGILAIKECIRNIGKKIPFRNSKITKILKETFNNKIYTYILSTISPLGKDLIDTIDTLKYITYLKKNSKKNYCLPPLKHKNNCNQINKFNLYLNNELNKKSIEKTKLLYIINENIKSLKDLKSNLINIS